MSPVRSQPSTKVCFRRLGFAPIALHDIRPAHPEFAGLADAHVAAVFADDPDFADRQREAAAVRAQLIVFGGVMGEGGRSFGHAPGGSGR